MLQMSQCTTLYLSLSIPICNELMRIQTAVVCVACKTGKVTFPVEGLDTNTRGFEQWSK